MLKTLDLLKLVENTAIDLVQVKAHDIRVFANGVSVDQISTSKRRHFQIITYTRVPYWQLNK